MKTSIQRDIAYIVLRFVTTAAIVTFAVVILAGFMSRWG